MESELCCLRRRINVMERALRKVPFGGRAIAAMVAEDEVELASIFESCRVASSPSRVAWEERATGAMSVDEGRRAGVEHRATNTEPLVGDACINTSIVQKTQRPSEHRATGTDPLVEHKATSTLPTGGGRPAPTEHKATSTQPSVEDKATATVPCGEGELYSLECKATSILPAAEHEAAEVTVLSWLDEGSALGPEAEARDTQGREQRRASDPARHPRALETMGMVLEALHSQRGIASVSAAFSYFGPTNMDGSFIETPELVDKLKSLDVLQPDQVAVLVSSLDPRGSGHVTYRDFRARAMSFLSSSQDYHAALSLREFSAILQRLHQRLQAQGRSLAEAFARWQRGGKATLDQADFLAGLRSLRLGLSSKEAAQVLETLGAWDMPSTPACSTGGEQAHKKAILPDGQVSLATFEKIVEWCAGQDEVRSWASATFERIRRQVVQRCLKAWARERTEAPARRHLSFSGFSALVADALPSASTTDTSALWCVLPKDDDAGNSLVDLDVFLCWLQPMAPGLSGSQLYSQRHCLPFEAVS